MVMRHVIPGGVIFTKEEIVTSKELFKWALNSPQRLMFKGRLIHNENDEPAKIYRTKIHEQKKDSINRWWCKNGFMHRDNGKPALDEFFSKGTYLNGNLHSYNDQPSFIQYQLAGNANKDTQKRVVKWKQWHQNRKLHRENGPAVETFLKDGKRISFEWFKNNRRHRADGPAFWENGRTLWWLDGVEVPKTFIEKPENYPLSRILNLKNIEVRRVLIANLGWSRLLEEAKAECAMSIKTIHEAKGMCLISIQPKVSWFDKNRTSLSDDDIFFILQVINSTPEPNGTFRTYHIRVPPFVETVDEAVAWTFGLSAEEYNPLQES